MLNNNYTEEMLDLKDSFVTKIKNSELKCDIYVDCILQTQVCPNCRHETKRIHSYRTQTVKDLPIFGKQTHLHVRRRRYYCPHCKKVFQEKLTFLPRYQRNTNRLLYHVMEDFRYEHSTASIAKRNFISPGIATRIFDRISYPKPRLPKVISIDEFKGNAGGHKFQCILTDPKKHKVLDILPARSTTDLTEYFLSFSLDMRRNVEYIVMDMSNQFRSIASFCFPEAKIIVDKFHLCRLANWAIENIRKQEQKKLGKKYRIFFKRSRWLVLSDRNKLSDAGKSHLSEMFSISNRLAKGYWLKEHFYTFARSKNIDEARKHLSDWNMAVDYAAMPEFAKCKRTIENWDKQVLRAFSMHYSNGYTEGCNNKIKVLKRNCYGVKNFSRFRNRILHMMVA